MLAKLFGANWSTTLFGTIAVVSTFVVAQPDLISGVIGPDLSKRIFSIAALVSGFIAFQQAKSKNVTGGTVQQTASGGVAAPGTQSLVDETLKSTALTPGEKLTAEQEHILRHKLSCVLAFLIPVFGFGSLTSCAFLQKNPALTCAATSLAVTNVLQYGVPANQRAEVAGQISAASDIFGTYSGGSVPSADQFKLLLDKYLPNNSARTITETNLIALYSAFLPSLQNKVPTAQLKAVKDFLACAKNGAAPFVANH